MPIKEVPMLTPRSCLHRLKATAAAALTVVLLSACHPATDSAAPSGSTPPAPPAAEAAPVPAPAQPTAPATAPSSPDEARMALIYSMYRDIRAIETGVGSTDPGANGSDPAPPVESDPFTSRMSDDFLAAFERFNATDTESDEGDDIACALHYDPIWGAQDYDPTVQVTVSMTDDGLVRAAYDLFGSPVEVFYEVSCTNGTCRIEDIREIDPQTQVPSLKAFFQQCIIQAQSKK